VLREVGAERADQPRPRGDLHADRTAGRRPARPTSRS
jgi:hypothetical protein